jgi:hypothetical protein
MFRRFTDFQLQIVLYKLHRDSHDTVIAQLQNDFPRVKPLNKGSITPAVRRTFLGFRKCGIVPFSDEPLHSKYAIDSPVDMEMVKRQEDPKRLWISSSVLTSERMIMTLVDAKRFASPMSKHDIVFHPPRTPRDPHPPEVVIFPDGRSLMFPWPFGNVQLQCKQCGQLLQRVSPWPPDDNIEVVVRGAILYCPHCNTRRLYLGLKSWCESQ